MQMSPKKKPEDVELLRTERGGVFLVINGRIRAWQGVMFGDTQVLLSPDDAIWLYQAIHKLVIKNRVALEWEPNVAAAIQALEQFELHSGVDPTDSDYDGTLVQDALDYLKEGRIVSRDAS